MEQTTREHVMPVLHSIEALRGDMTRAANWVYANWLPTYPTPTLVVDDRGVGVVGVCGSLRELHTVEAGMCDRDATVVARQGDGPDSRYLRAARAFGDRVRVEAVYDAGERL